MSGFVDADAAEAPEEQEQVEAEEGEDGLPADEEEASDGSGDGEDEEGGSGSDSDDSSAEGDDEDEFEKDGFIVDEEEEEEGEDKEGSDVEGAADAKKRRKKGKKRHRELVLDEEDYELLEDNTGIRRVRPQQQHRRIKKARDAEGGGAGAQQHETARALQEELFGLEDNGLEDEDEEEGAGAGAVGGARPGDRARIDARQGGRDEAPRQEPDDQFFDDDEDDWLVHEDEEEGAEGAQANRERRRRRRAAFEGIPDIDPDALAEADEIFGNVDELLSMYEERKAARDVEEEGWQEEEAEGEEDLDDEAAEERRVAREDRQRATAARRLQGQLDPEAMARHFLLPKDEQIRETDVPEREQVHRGPDPANFDFAAAAHWVLLNLHDHGGKAYEILEDGVREVEGPPPAWYGSSTWDSRDLKGDLHDIASHRALYRGRDDERARRDWKRNDEAQADLRHAIEAVLRQHYEKHEEIPFIAQYRKELCGELLAVRAKDEPKHAGSSESHMGFPAGTIRAQHRRIRRYEVMFAVQQLAQRWKAMQVRKEARLRAYQKAQDDTMHSEEQAAIQGCLDLLKQADTMEELDDVDAKFRLATQQFAAEDAMSQLSLAPGSARRPQKSTSYALCLRAGLGDWVAGLGMTAGQLVENTEAGYKKHVPADLQVTPLEHSETFAASAGGFSSAELVLKGGCHVAATQIAAEPLIRSFVRKQYEKHATVSTAPTPAGEAALDAFHPLGPAKRLSGKPLHKFEGTDQFLRVLQAEKEGLVTVELGLNEERRSEVLESLAESYLSGGLSEAAVAWDEVRRGVLSEALRSMLLPSLEREARARLAADARLAVLDEAADRLWGYASQAPLQVKLVDDEEVEPDRRVMAVCYGTGIPATTFVMLDPAGNLVDYLHTAQFSGPIPKRKALLGIVYDMFEDPKKGQDAQRIRQFIETHKPHAIVVGASSPEARTLEQDLGVIREQILLDNPRFVIELGTGELQILMADEAVAAAWENSAPAREELAAATPSDIVRRAVALGRQLLDPLALLASLCGRGKEVLALQLHPLQAQVPDDDRLAMVERVMTTATSQVGVDLNAVVSSTWQAAPLQFTPGLGPRKAAALLRAVQRAGGFVESRQQVWRELGVTGNKVFKNAAPYLRIRASAKGTANLEMDPLDDTRIHPEHYAYAVQMAKSAVPGEGAEDEPDVAVENAFARPQEVESLDLIFYDQHLQEDEAESAAEGDGDGPRSRLAMLIDIQMEFVAPYGELRKELAPLKPEDVFWLCSGESKETLRPGRRVEARVRTVGDMDARCVLADINGIEALIERSEVSRTAGDEISVRDFLQPNQTVPARVIQVLPGEGVVKLSTRSDRLSDDLTWERKYLAYNEDMKCGDKYYKVPTPAEVKEAAAEARRKAAPPKFKARPIQHPLFKNISMTDAADLLVSPEVPLGQCVIRPSTRGPHVLCLTMKMPLSIWHVDIEEKGKAPGSLKLGSSLMIEWTPNGNKESYEDLDEVAARYVEPVQELLTKLTKHRKWKGEPWERAQEELRIERETSQGRAVYCLGPDSARSHAFWLGHILGRSPHREFFMITPEGYRFRKKEYPTVEGMIKAWQKNPRLQVAAEQPPPPPPAERQDVRHDQVPRGMAAGRGMAPGPGMGPGPEGGYYPQQGQPPLPPPMQAQQVYGSYGQGQPAMAMPPAYGGVPPGGMAGPGAYWQGAAPVQPGMQQMPLQQGGYMQQPGMGGGQQDAATEAARAVAARFNQQHQEQQAYMQQPQGGYPAPGGW